MFISHYLFISHEKDTGRSARRTYQGRSHPFRVPWPHKMIPRHTLSLPSGVSYSTVNIFAGARLWSTRVRTVACMAGLLTCFCPDAFPSSLCRQWQEYCPDVGAKLTAACPVRDFHPIPFYFPHRMATGKPIRAQR